jgi:predicted RNA binding protein YcfA (HicA-like mRNA interferase family)
MSKPRIPFGTLQQFLLDLGFDKVVVPGSHVGFHHAASGAEIMLPVYQIDQLVAPRYLLLVSVTLDAKRLMGSRQFDEFLESQTAAQTAS